QAFAVGAEEGDRARLAECDIAVDVEEVVGIERGRDDAVERPVCALDASGDADRELAVTPHDERRADEGLDLARLALGDEMRAVAGIAANTGRALGYVAVGAGDHHGADLRRRRDQLAHPRLEPAIIGEALRTSRRDALDEGAEHEVDMLDRAR